ncbi:ComF family protein [Dorea formicigenerans]|uniref:ComF family protein n=1 Tax=Dorea formicigenerans TaxID=39486 RepID=UPI0022E6320E|nr:phosphoribosyltransferase family protein [Dorea formicigenerans]
MHLLREEIRTDFRRVIIIDDIYTTGNTVDQVAKVLKTMGFQKVYFLTISIGQGY